MLKKLTVLTVLTITIILGYVLISPKTNDVKNTKNTATEVSGVAA